MRRREVQVVQVRGFRDRRVGAGGGGGGRGGAAVVRVGVGGCCWGLDEEALEGGGGGGVGAAVGGVEVVVVVGGVVGVCGGCGGARAVVVAKESAEDGAFLPLGDEGVLLGRVLDGARDEAAGAAAEVALDQGVEAGDGAEDGAPRRGALLVRVEGGTVALLRAAALGRAQVEAGLVVLLADAALGLAVVAGLVVDVAKVTAGRRGVGSAGGGRGKGRGRGRNGARGGDGKGGTTYAREAFFLLRGFGGASLPASPPGSLFAAVTDSATDMAPVSEGAVCCWCWTSPAANWAAPAGSMGAVRTVGRWWAAETKPHMTEAGIPRRHWIPGTETLCGKQRGRVVSAPGP